MPISYWFIALGFIFTVMGLSASWVKRVPITGSLFYLAAGAILGPRILGLLDLSATNQAPLLEVISEIVVAVSLFSAGMKLRHPFRDSRWKLALRLATLSMIFTAGLITLFCVSLLDLPLGVAVVIGGILAPTDPVLASDVQMDHPDDKDRLRFSLTGEAGFNDGTAFPIVLLGLGLLGKHELGSYGLKWFATDVLWSGFGGLAIGGILGTLIGKVIIAYRQKGKETAFFDDFVALGLIALSYGIAVQIGVFGFLSVFAAGVALRRVEHKKSGERPLHKTKEGHSGSVPAETAEGILHFNEQIERLGEVIAVVLLGVLVLNPRPLALDLLLIPALFFLIRPLSVFLGLYGTDVKKFPLAMTGWFGIRGIGSIYYLFYVVNHGLPEEYVLRVEAITISVVTASIIIHGISVTPLMNAYRRRLKPSA